MDGPPPTGLHPAGDLEGYASLAAELATLKRITDARSPDSMASRMFRRAWASLCAGLPVNDVAMAISADALCACRLGGIDKPALLQIGLDPAEANEVLLASFDEIADKIPVGMRKTLRRHVGVDPAPATSTPGFVEALIRQPRAGATCPGKPRLVMQPPEGHGDHCLAVAVLGVILSEEFQADPAAVFLAGLSHHFHNATLPDAGFAGEMLLGAHLTPILRRLTQEAIETLPPELGRSTRDALADAVNDTTPEGRAFNAADVIDRIMEVRHFAAVASFTEAHALEEMQLVHAGPIQAFHHQVLRRAGLLPA